MKTIVPLTFPTVIRFAMSYVSASVEYQFLTEEKEGRERP